MSYKLTSKETPGEGVCRIAREQGGSILESLGEKLRRREGDAIHNARKSVKKMRALLRLVCDELGGRTFQRENRSYRDIGRKLSALRDAEVLVNAVHKLRDCYGERVDPSTFAAAEKALQSKRDQARKGLGAVRGAAERSLREALKRIDSWPLDKVEWDSLHRGLKRTYRQGRESFVRACGDPTAENLHEWRKRVKDLWYHLRFLNAVWPEVMGDLARHVKVLSEYLGDDHDFAVLHETLARKRLPKEDWEILEKLIEARRFQLEVAAFDLGGRLYVERPKAFARRIEGYGATWRASKKPEKKRLRNGGGNGRLAAACAGAAG